MKKIFILAALAGMILVQSEPLTVHAAEACDLKAEVAQIKKAQTDTSLNESEQLNAELAARRNLLIAVIECDQADIIARKEALGRMPESIKSIEAHRRILNDLESVYGYYERRKAGVRSLNLRNLRISSRALDSWRQETYVPLATWADNFLIWADNQQFLERASQRLDQVNKVAFSLKLVNQDEINGLFERAKRNFDIAFAENDKARDALNQKNPAGALAYTQTSLKALADTYDAFFDLQKALQDIVK